MESAKEWYAIRWQNQNTYINTIHTAITICVHITSLHWPENLLYSHSSYFFNIITKQLCSILKHNISVETLLVTTKGNQNWQWWYLLSLKTFALNFKYHGLNEIVIICGLAYLWMASQFKASGNVDLLEDTLVVWKIKGKQF